MRIRSTLQNYTVLSKRNWYNFMEGNFFNIILPPFWKGSTLKWNLLLIGSKFFSLRVDLFSEGTWWAEEQAGSHKKLSNSKENVDNLPTVFSRLNIQGPVVQSVVSLTSSLRVISLTVLANSIYNILILFAEKMWVAFFSKKLSAYLRITRCIF